MCNMLSYVEFYRPKFFLLENVLGLLNHKLQINKAGSEGNIVAHGVVKFILRALTSLGYVGIFPPANPTPTPPTNLAETRVCRDHNRYQVRFSVLQAGVYGAPQGRRRVIFWGARRGVPLPEFPIPSHNFETTAWAVQLDTGLKLDHVSRDPDRPHRGAPLRAVTVDDAISDLVRFSHLYRCGASWKSHRHMPPLLSPYLRPAAQIRLVRNLARSRVSVNLTRELLGTYSGRQEKSARCFRSDA